MREYYIAIVVPGMKAGRVIAVIDINNKKQ